MTVPEGTGDVAKLTWSPREVTVPNLSEYLAEHDAQKLARDPNGNPTDSSTVGANRLAIGRLSAHEQSVVSYRVSVLTRLVGEPSAREVLGAGGAHHAGHQPKHEKRLHDQVPSRSRMARPTRAISSKTRSSSLS